MMFVKVISVTFVNRIAIDLASLGTPIRYPNTAANNPAPGRLSRVSPPLRAHRAGGGLLARRQSAPLHLPLLERALFLSLTRAVTCCRTARSRAETR